VRNKKCGRRRAAKILALQFFRSPPALGIARGSVASVRAIKGRDRKLAQANRAIEEMLERVSTIKWRLSLA
jgi:hypothetical protein